MNSAQAEEETNGEGVEQQQGWMLSGKRESSSSKNYDSTCKTPGRLKRERSNSATIEQLQLKMAKLQEDVAIVKTCSESSKAEFPIQQFLTIENDNPLEAFLSKPMTIDEMCLCIDQLARFVGDAMKILDFPKEPSHPSLSSRLNAFKIYIEEKINAHKELCDIADKGMRMFAYRKSAQSMAKKKTAGVPESHGSGSLAISASTSSAPPLPPTMISSPVRAPPKADALPSPAPGSSNVLAASVDDKLKPSGLIDKPSTQQGPSTPTSLEGAEASNAMENANSKMRQKYENVSKRLPGQGKVLIGGEYYSFNTKAGIDHRVELKLKCESCSMEFRLRSELNFHQKKCKFSKCQFCGESFGTNKKHKCPRKCAFLGNPPPPEDSQNPNPSDCNIATFGSFGGTPAAPQPTGSTQPLTQQESQLPAVDHGQQDQVQDSGVMTGSLAKRFEFMEEHICNNPMEVANMYVDDEESQVISGSPTLPLADADDPSVEVVPLDIAPPPSQPQREHGIDPGKENRCLCGVSYGSWERLMFHIKGRSRIRQ